MEPRGIGGREPRLRGGSGRARASLPSRWGVALAAGLAALLSAGIASATDADGDGVADGIDNCPDDFNPEQRNNNSGGMGDTCDDTDGNLISNTDKLAPETGV